jgi:hypothetical protein
MAASKIGGLFVSLDLNYAKFVQGLDRSRTKSTAFGVAVGNIMTNVAASVARIGVQAATSLPRLVANSIDVADAMGKAAQKAQVSVESFSALAHAAELSDVSMESLVTSLGRFGRNIAEAQSGNKKLAAAFTDVGVSLAELRTLPVDEVFAKVAGGFAAIPDGARKAKVGFDLFGRAYQDLVPLLNQGNEGIRRSVEEAKALGLVIGGNTAKQAEQFNDNLKSIRSTVSGVGLAISKEMLPRLTALTESTLEWIKSSSLISRVAQLFTDFFQGVVIEIGAAGVAFDGAVVTLRSFENAYLKTLRVMALGAPGGFLLLPNLDKQIKEAESSLKEAQVKLGKQLDAFDVLIGNRAAPKLPPVARKVSTELPELVDNGAQKKLESLAESFQNTLNPADELEKEIQSLTKAIGSSAGILDVYGEKIIEAVDAQRRHGLAVSDGMLALANQARQLGFELTARERLTEAMRAQIEMRFKLAAAPTIEADAISGLNALTVAYEDAAAAMADMAALNPENFVITIPEVEVVQNVDKVFAELGLKSKFELQGIADAAKKAYDESGLAAERGTERELTARLTMLSAQREAIISAGQEFTKLQQKELETAQLQLDKFSNQDKLKNGFEQIGVAISSGIEDAMKKWEGFGKLAIGILDDIAATILRNSVTAPLTSWLSGALNIGISALSGGGSALAVPAANGLGTESFGQFLSGFRAEGGPVQPGERFMVGERGPEIFVPKTAGTVIPNDAIGGGGTQTVIQYNIDARGASAGIGEEIRRALRDVEDRAVMRSLRTAQELKLRTA